MSIFSEVGAWALSSDENLPAPQRRDMVLSVGLKVQNLIVTSGFAATVDTPVGRAMQARLTAGVVYQQGWADMVEVSAPPAWWEVLGRWCRAQVDQNRIGTASHKVAAVRQFAHLGLRIDRELTRLEAHPAYHGQAIAGVEPLVLPAYRVAQPNVPADSWPIAPTPTRALRLCDWAAGDMEAGEMQPYVAQVRGQWMTMWLWSAEASPGPDEPGGAG